MENNRKIKRLYIVVLPLQLFNTEYKESLHFSYFIAEPIKKEKTSATAHANLIGSWTYSIRLLIFMDFFVM